ncbi:MAG: hypothetical protein QW146_07875 [Candidatus Bathyarchaeia archaeon]
MLNKKILLTVMLVTLTCVIFVSIIILRNIKSREPPAIPAMAYQIADELKRDQELRLHYWKDGEKIIVAYVNGTLFEREYYVNENSAAITEIKQLMDNGTPIAFTYLNNSSIIAHIIPNSYRTLWETTNLPWQLVLVKVFEDVEPHTGIRKGEAHYWINEKTLAESIYNAYLLSCEIT